MSIPKGPPNRTLATTSRNSNSQNPQFVSQLMPQTFVGRHPNVWSAKYSQYDGMITMSVMARNHRTREVTTAFVHVHSKSLVTRWSWGTLANPMIMAPTTMGGIPAAARNNSTGAYFVTEPISPRVIVWPHEGLVEPHYIGGPRA